MLELWQKEFVVGAMAGPGIMECGMRGINNYYYFSFIILSVLHFLVAGSDRPGGILF